MTNLDEFVKVFFIVFTMSGGILFLRHFITNYEEESEDLNNRIDVNFRQNNPDSIDYDGMGNQGRFPIVKKK
mgnify:CR=1 FL=1|tara:strand:- start:789 stop:1004 length:216 start_codon:yes stop_codon:yes gene_type:complete